MALQRAEIPLAVNRSTGTVSGGSVPIGVSGASVSVNIRGLGPATIYAAETGGTTLANPLTTTADGRIDGWLDEGSYDLTISGGGITTYTQPLEVISGKSLVNIPGDRLTTASVQGTALVDNTLPGAKLVAASVTPLKLANSVIPLGTVISLWRPSNAYALPTGWAVADGSIVNSSNHDFGTGGSITLPDLRNKMVLGADATATWGSAGSTSVAPGVHGVGGANSFNFSHAHLINDHYHLAQGSQGAWSGNLATDDHLHGASGLYVPNHAHGVALGTNSGNRGIVMQQGGGLEPGTFLNHQHFVSGNTGGSGDFGVGGVTGASDRGLYTRGNTSGVSDRNTNSVLTTTDMRSSYVGLIYLIKVKAI